MVAEVAEDDRRRRLDELVGAPAAFGDGRDPDIDGLDARVGRDDRVGRPQERVAEQIGDLRLADPRQPVGPRGDLGTETVVLESWHDVVGPHRAHLARRTRQRDDDATVRPVDEPARRRPVRVGERRGRRDQPRLLEVELGERHPASGPQVAQPGLEAGVDLRRLTTRRGDRLAGQVVGGRAQSAGRDDEVGTGQAGRERVGHLVEVVGEGGQTGDPDAHPGQGSGQLPGVRVARLADGQFAADAQQFGGQESAAFEGCHVFAA